MLPVEMGHPPITYLECRLEVQKAGCCDTVCAVIMALRQTSPAEIVRQMPASNSPREKILWLTSLFLTLPDCPPLRVYL
jgi:hypothetical protein